DRLHQHAIVNVWAAARPRRSNGRSEGIVSIRSASNLSLLEWIRTGCAVPLGQGYPAPFNVIGDMPVVIDLDVTDHGISLVNMSDAAELNPIAEAGGDIVRRRKGAQVARRDTRQKEEDERAACENEHHEQGGRGEQSSGQLAMR